jgi:hypothetical protein
MARIAAALALAVVATFGVTGSTQRSASEPKPPSPPLASPDGNLENDAAVEMETRDTGRGQALQFPMRAAGGFVVRFTR